MCDSNGKSLQPEIQVSVLAGEQCLLIQALLCAPKRGKSWSMCEAVTHIRLDMDTSQTDIMWDRRCLWAPAKTSQAQN